MIGSFKTDLILQHYWPRLSIERIATFSQKGLVRGAASQASAALRIPRGVSKTKEINMPTQVTTN